MASYFLIKNIFTEFCLVLGCPRSKVTDFQVDGMNLYFFLLKRSNRADQTFGSEHTLI